MDIYKVQSSSDVIELSIHKNEIQIYAKYNDISLTKKEAKELMLILNNLVEELK